AAHVDDDLVVKGHRTLEKRQGDALLQGRAEGAGRDHADLLPLAVPDDALAARDAASGDEEALEQPRGLGHPLGHEGVLAPEDLLVPADGPRRATHDRGDVRGEVLAVEWVAHLGA